MLCQPLSRLLSILHYKDMTSFVVMQIFFNKNDYAFSHYFYIIDN